MITVYGSSDDLIEVDGDISEEFYAIDPDEGDLLAFSDGTLLRVVYDNDGVWRITPIETGSGFRRIDQSAPGDNDDYSDVAYLEGVRWVAHGRAYARTKTAVPA